MPSLLTDLPSQGFFSSHSVLHQLLVSLQPPEPWQKQQTLTSFPYTHTNPIFHVEFIACPSQLFFSSVSVTAEIPTPSLYACLTTGSQDSTERCHFTSRKEHAEKFNSCLEKQLPPSHTSPESLPLTPRALLTCFPIWGGFFYNQNTTTLPTNVQRTNTTWAYMCL